MPPPARLERVLARSFALFVLVTTAPAIARAQSEVHPMYVAGPDVNIAPDPAAPVPHWPFSLRIFRSGHNHDWGLHAQQTPIPRTYSYYYTPWFNHPRHYRVVEPDGTTGWRTTVHGQPWGTPWPSYLVPIRPQHH